MDYLITFFTHSGAIAFSRRVKALGLAPKMMPVPRRVSSSCGTGVKVRCELGLTPLVDPDVDRIFTCAADDYTMVHQNPEV